MREAYQMGGDRMVIVHDDWTRAMLNKLVEQNNAILKSNIDIIRMLGVGPAPAPFPCEYPKPGKEPKP